MFVKEVQDHNNKVDLLNSRSENWDRLVKIQKADTKGGYDYFARPEIMHSITRKLGYEIRDLNMAKSRRQDNILEQLRNDWNKCENKLNNTVTEVQKTQRRIEVMKQTNKFN